MNTRVVLFSVVLGGALAGAAGVPYSAADGTATFEHRVAFVTVQGTVQGVRSRVTLDPEDLGTTTGTVTVPLSGLKTGIELRDRHATGPRALDTARFPNATFELEQLTGGRLTEGQLLATTARGRLTVRGVTRAIRVPVKATLGSGEVRVSTQFKFNPHDFGVNYPGSSDSVTVGASFTLRAD